MYAIFDKNKRIKDVLLEAIDGEHCHKLTARDIEKINADPLGHVNFIFSEGAIVYDEAPRKPYPDFEPVYHSPENPHEMMMFGNIWTRKIFFAKAGEVYEGHEHDHDHTSLLMSGSVSLAVPGYKPVIFTAPAQIIIRAEYEHEITAREDNTLWWCVHAKRDEGGEVIDLYSELNDPLAHPI